MQHIYKRLCIKIKTICPFNCWSLKSKNLIRTINKIIAKQLSGTGQMWAHYLLTCTYACNSFASPALNGIRQLQLNFGRSPKFLLEIDTNPQEGTSRSFKDYYELMWKRFVYFQKIVKEYKLQQMDMINKDKPIIVSTSGKVINPNTKYSILKFI